MVNRIRGDFGQISGDFLAIRSLEIGKEILAVDGGRGFYIEEGDEGPQEHRSDQKARDPDGSDPSSRVCSCRTSHQHDCCGEFGRLQEGDWNLEALSVEELAITYLAWAVCG